jgi:xylulokinase
VRYILAYDVGTTGNKSSLYDEDGSLVGSCFAEYPTAYPRATWAEQNPQHWWRSLVDSTNSLLRSSPIRAQDVACLTFSGQMMGVVAVDQKARPLRDAIIWADQRAVSQVSDIARRIDPRRVYALTGHRLSPSYSAAKMLWMKDLEPHLYGQTHCFLQAKDFLIAELTGRFGTDPSDASGTNVYDLTRRDWSAELLDAFGLPAEKLPAIYQSTDIVGEVHSSAAKETGLRAGTPVVMGGGDGCCAATGAGVIREGTAYNYIGSSSWIALATRRPILDPQMRTFTFAHLVPGMFSPCGTMQAAGASYQWARDALFRADVPEGDRADVSPYELLNQAVLQSPPGAHALLFLPYLLGERSPHWNPNARGAFVGLTVRHRQADMLRAVLEGVTLNLRVILEAFQRQGAAIEALRLIGGGAQSAVWNQIMADIFGVPVLRLSLSAEATSMGAAVAGGVGVGIWKDFSQVDRMVQVAGRSEPDKRREALYSGLYEIFTDAYCCLDGAGIFDRLASLDS